LSVRYERVDRLAVVTIDRPEKRNAMDMSVFTGLAEAAARAGEDDSARAVLVRGAGDTFSSGIDLGLLLGAIREGGFTEEDGRGLQASLTAYEELDKPVIAAIAGPCLGAALQLALACHVRVVTPTAWLSALEVAWALVPDLGGTFRLPRLVGLGRATELTLTGRRVEADEAVRIGLAEVLVSDLDEATAFAARLAAGPGSAGRVPRLLRENLRRDREEALAAELSAQMECLRSADFAEAARARLEGRDPTYGET
jgi:enoyl-CoA hydratase/carnithine racemase